MTKKQKRTRCNLNLARGFPFGSPTAVDWTGFEWQFQGREQFRASAAPTAALHSSRRPTCSCKSGRRVIPKPSTSLGLNIKVKLINDGALELFYLFLCFASSKCRPRRRLWTVQSRTLCRPLWKWAIYFWLPNHGAQSEKIPVGPINFKLFVFDNLHFAEIFHSPAYLPCERNQTFQAESLCDESVPPAAPAATQVAPANSIEDRIPTNDRRTYGAKAFLLSLRLWY